MIFSCKVKRKEYIERNGLHSDDKPSQIAKDLGSQHKKQKRAYVKQLKRTSKAIKKRNKQKLKNIYPLCHLTLSYGEDTRRKEEWPEIATQTQATLSPLILN